MNETIKLINKSMDNGYQGPISLFKYRPFDNFTFDMLENNYAYLTPAEKLDDKSECNTSINLEQLYDLATNNLKAVCVQLIIDSLKPYTSLETFEIVKEKIMNVCNRNGTVKSNFMLDVSFELQKLIPEYDFVPLINWITGIPEKLDDPTVRPQFEKLISIGINAKKEIGVCSLTESYDNERLWNEYADNSRGYCIEYDMENYSLNNNVFPVVYTDERDTSIITQLVLNFIGQMIIGFSHGEINADKSQYIRLFLTKNIIWQYQQEWRIVGNAGYKALAPKIKNIYLGKNVKKEDKDNMINYCQQNKINLIQK